MISRTRRTVSRDRVPVAADPLAHVGTDVRRQRVAEPRVLEDHRRGGGAGLAPGPGHPDQVRAQQEPGRRPELVQPDGQPVRRGHVLQAPEEHGRAPRVVGLRGSGQQLGQPVAVLHQRVHPRLEAGRPSGTVDRGLAAYRREPERERGSAPLQDETVRGAQHPQRHHVAVARVGPRLEEVHEPTARDEVERGGAAQRGVQRGPVLPRRPALRLERRRQPGPVVVPGVAAHARVRRPWAAGRSCRPSPCRRSRRPARRRWAARRWSARSPSARAAAARCRRGRGSCAPRR